MLTDRARARGLSIAPGRTVAAALFAASVAAWGLRPAPDPGWLGVTLDEVTHEGRPAVRLAKILPESPAVQIGLVAGDLVRVACGRRVGAPRDLVRVVRGSAPGSRCTLTIERAGARRSLD